MSIFFLLVLIFSTDVFAETKDKSTIEFKNLRSGYEVSHPGDWYPVSSDEPDNSTGLDIPPSESNYVTMYLNAEKRKNCKYEPACRITIISLSDGTRTGYRKAIDYISNFRKNEKISIIQKSTLNGYKYEIDLRALGKTDFSINTYFFCEDSNRIFNFSTERKLDSEYRSFANQDNPLKLEIMYNAEQLTIINSFKCPIKNFKYKKTTPKTKKK